MHARKVLSEIDFHSFFATLAQLVEQLICNQQVVGSSPTSGSKKRGRFQSGQMGRTVNPLSFDFRGSNPLLPTVFCISSFALKNY
jgi:hypothetical protein